MLKEVGGSVEYIMLFLVVIFTPLWIIPLRILGTLRKTSWSMSCYIEKQLNWLISIAVLFIRRDLVGCSISPLIFIFLVQFEKTHPDVFWLRFGNEQTAKNYYDQLQRRIDRTRGRSPARLVNRVAGIFRGRHQPQIKKPSDSKATSKAPKQWYFFIN